MKTKNKKINSDLEFQRKIFTYLFKIAGTSHDSEGVVSACLVRNNKILLSTPSADDSVEHAEYILIKQADSQKLQIHKNDILFVTVEPCSQRSPGRHIEDCTTVIINSGIKNIVYAATDPYQTNETKKRFMLAGIRYSQTEDRNLQEQARTIFNTTQLNPKKRKL